VLHDHTAEQPSEADAPSTQSGFEVGVVLDGLANMGVAVAVLCREFGIDRDELSKPFARVSSRTFFGVLARARSLTRDPLIGLGLAQAAQARGLISYMMRSQETLGDALREFCRFQPVLFTTQSPRPWLTLEPRGSTVALVIAPDSDGPLRVVIDHPRNAGGGARLRPCTDTAPARRVPGARSP
jgi:Arabinose-binding domain of AraC transcription regulator, N-term